MDLPVRSPKLALSAAEWQLASQDAFILTKHRIIAEVYEIFGCLADVYRQQAASLTVQHPQAFLGQPKISKGEQYEQMPWVMLDYPRCFDKQGNFAIRSFFWWGHHFSIRLQLSGEYASRFGHIWPQLQQQGWLCGSTSNPWNYELPNAEWNEHTDCTDTAANIFYIAAKKIPVSQWAQAFQFYAEAYQQLVAALQKY
ncbi:MAG: hypothetical protein IT252_01935 [Chitinophagaceae bacterium]|nr:hypothetical protein [Chitinophagaceae bacterium]